jgi:hypothetical protein
MIGRRSFAGLMFAGAAVFALEGCSLLEPSEMLRYRLTVEVETPEGVKSGYSVWEYRVTDIKVGFTPQSTEQRGEAVAVELPNGQTLFALLIDGDGFPDYPRHVIEDMLRQTPEYKANYETAFLEVFPVWTRGRKSWVVPPWRSPSGPSEKPRSAYPMLVTFKDIADPASVKRVDPGDMSTSFGKGYRIKAITVQVTDEQVTTGVQDRLPKPLYKGFYNWDGKSNPNDGKTFSITNFSNGVSK